MNLQQHVSWSSLIKMAVKEEKKNSGNIFNNKLYFGGEKSKQTEIAVYSACGKLNTTAPCSHKDWATNWEISPTLNC